MAVKVSIPWPFPVMLMAVDARVMRAENGLSKLPVAVWIMP